MCPPVCDVLMVFRTSTRVLGFLQTKLISLVVFLFCKIQEVAIASSCLLLAMPMVVRTREVYIG